MADKTFRQTVEEILSFTECEDDGRICSDMTLDKYEERPSCEQCRTDRICEAIGKTAEGMQRTGTHPDEHQWNAGADYQYQECQAYWKEQVK